MEGSPQADALLDSLVMLIASIIELPWLRIIAGFAFGFGVVFVIFYIRDLLKPLLKRTIGVTILITLVVIFVNRDIATVDWTLLSIYADRLLANIIYAINNWYAMLPYYYLDTWTFLGAAFGGYQAYKRANPPKPPKTEWEGKGTVVKK